MRKTKIIINLIVLLLIVSSTVYAQVTTPRAASPAAKASQTIGISSITVKYSRPAVNEREIWGKLVPYGYNNLGFGTATEAPWRAGANENTTIKFSHDAKVEGKSIPAGTYGFFVAPLENGTADIIFSKNTTSWGSFFYSEDEDQLRVNIKPVENSHTERLTYDFVDIDNSGATMVLDWEKMRFPVKVEFEVNDLVVANFKDELRGTAGFNWIGPATAANYCVQNDTHLEDGKKWAEQAYSANKNFNTAYVQASVNEKLEKEADAIKFYDEAAQLANVGQLNFLGYQMMGKEKTDKAVEYFALNVEKNPDNANCHDSYGEGLKAKGDNKAAIKEFKKALSLDPPQNVRDNSIKHLKELGVDVSSYEASASSK